MPQEFHVLKCFSCSTFQVHIVKKSSNKWQCKMCNEKQSLKQVFGRGTGQECRIHVQKLNTQRLTNEAEQTVLRTDREMVVGRAVREVPAFEDTSGHKQPTPESESKWSSFLDVADEESSDEEDPVQMALRAGSLKRARKAPNKQIRKKAAREGDVDSEQGQNLEDEELVPNAKNPKNVSKWGQFVNNEEESSSVKDVDQVSSKWGQFAKEPREACVAEKAKNQGSKWGQFLESEDKIEVSPRVAVVSGSSKWDKFVNQPEVEGSGKSDVVEKGTGNLIGQTKKQNSLDFMFKEEVDDEELDALLTF